VGSNLGQASCARYVPSIDLVQDRVLPQISVADVADRADVSRSTFYDHDQDVHELAEAACTSMLDDLFGFALALRSVTLVGGDLVSRPEWQVDHPAQRLR
jgi:AcrR family transcriptional regulator